MRRLALLAFWTADYLAVQFPASIAPSRSPLASSNPNLSSCTGGAGNGAPGEVVVRDAGGARAEHAPAFRASVVGCVIPWATP